MPVRADLNLSLDGFATTTDQTADNPFGDDWPRLVEAYTSTRTFRERVLHDTSGEGTTGVDDKYASSYFADVGAEIMGAGMFGLHQFPDDPDWKGWWGDEPPFHIPVFVLTHSTPRPSIEFAAEPHFTSSPHHRRRRSNVPVTLPPAAMSASGAVQRSYVTSSPPASSTGSTLPLRRSCWEAAFASGTICAGSSQDST